jgi:Di-haem oxidoreductase, putative peroxidase
MRTSKIISSVVVLWMIIGAAPIGAHEPHVCPPGINDTPALPGHLNQADVIRLPFHTVFNEGKRIFATNFNRCDGAGRPGTNGGVKERTPNPLEGPRFTRISAPDASACSSCHNQPVSGGAGDFVANVFVLAQNEIPVSGEILDPDFNETFLERKTLGMFGSGAIELLGREMTADLLALKAQAIREAHGTGHRVTMSLVTKGVSFGTITAHPDGLVDSSGVDGIDPDLIVKPFSRKGVMRSVREFTVNAINQHHGMQPVERFGLDTDPDKDGITNELSIGDITAVSVFQEALPVPVRQRPAQTDIKVVKRGEALFSQIHCVTCHIPALPLNSTRFCDPDRMNPASGPFKTFNDTSRSYCFDLQQISGLYGNMVHAYTDLKRHVICDSAKPHFCNEPMSLSLLQPSDTKVPCPMDQFLTAKLWTVGNSGPWGHRGDLDTIYEAIIAHGGEATASEAQFEALSDSDQSAVVAFLKTLVMPSTNDPASKLADSSNE